MRLFTLFTSDARAVEHVRGLGRAVDDAIARIAGREEWGVRLLLDERKAREARTLSAARAAGTARSGVAFLLRKQADREARRRLIADARAEADALYERLAALADDARRRPAATVDSVKLLLDAAFLLSPSRRARFDAATRAAAKRADAIGASLVVTGPWPAYSFVGKAR
jgi:hypothetical protein